MTATSPHAATQIAHWQQLKSDQEALRNRYQEEVISLGNILGDLPCDDPRGFYDRQTINWLAVLQIEHCERDIARYDAWLDGYVSVDNLRTSI